MCKCRRTQLARWASFASILIGGAGCAASSASESTWRPGPPQTQPAATADLPPEYRVRIEPLAVPIRLKWFPWFGFDADPPKPQRFREHLPILVSELMRYPPAFLEQIRLKKVVICGEVISRGSGHVHGIAATRQKAIYVITGLLAPRENDWRREVLHHELYHMLDARDGDAHDQEWEALNPQGFQYGEDVEEENWTGLDRGGEGFLCRHGRDDIGEDKAYYFSHLVTNYAAVRELGKRDASVQAKADLMERMMAEYDPFFDAAFWADACVRSEPYRAQAGKENGWLSDEPRPPVEAGIDPLEPDRDYSEAFARVRLTRFPNSSRWASAPGRMTRLATPWHMLVHDLYWLPAARCTAPPELTEASFDVIVSLPDGKEEYDPRIQQAARKAFESDLGITMRKETREVEVYVLKRGPEGTRLLEAAAKRAERARAAAKFKALWRRPSPESFNYGPGESMVGMDFDDGEARFVIRSGPVSMGLSVLEVNGLDLPAIDETDFQKPIDVAVPYQFNDEKATLQALAKALGLEVVKARRSIEVTLFERSPATQP